MAVIYLQIFLNRLANSLRIIEAPIVAITGVSAYVAFLNGQYVVNMKITPITAKHTSATGIITNRGIFRSTVS